RTWRYRVGPAGRDHADPSVLELSATVGRDALKPLAPVHVSAMREADGIRLSWIRRSRHGGDAWEPVDIPLGEDAERYEVDLVKDGLVCRSFAVSQPSLLYPGDLEVADFG